MFVRFIFIFVVVCALYEVSYASDDIAKPVHKEWSFEGPFGRYDRTSLKRGYKVYNEVHLNLPDIVLIIRAREKGADYLYDFIIGEENLHLVDGQITYEDDVPETVQQYVTDLVGFLYFAADPHMEERKRTGLRVVAFLLVFALIMNIVNRRAWKEVKLV